MGDLEGLGGAAVACVRCWFKQQIVLSADLTSSPRTAKKFLVMTDCAGWCFWRRGVFFFVDTSAGRIFFARTGSCQLIVEVRAVPLL